MNNNEITILGAGNGGRAFAVYLSDLGFKVNLGFRTYENISTILRTHKINSKGILKGKYKIGRVSPNYNDLIRHSKYIFIVIPANLHYEIVERILPSLRNGQAIILNPGRTFGAVEVYNLIKTKRPKLQIFVAETQSLLFTCRKIGDSGVDIIKIKNSLDICFYPEKYHHTLQKELKTIFPQFNFVDNILVTSLNNIGALLHPTISILNAGSILRREEFLFYNEMSLQIANVIKEMDKERCLVLKRLGIRPKSFLQWVKESYGIEATNYFEAFKTITPYRTITSPKKLHVRYLTEDVPTGLVPLSSLGNYLNLDMPITNSLISLAGVLLGVDFKRNGRSLSRTEFPIEKYLRSLTIVKEKHNMVKSFNEIRILTQNLDKKTVKQNVKTEYLLIDE